jgi:hypothetical protein
MPTNFSIPTKVEFTLFNIKRCGLFLSWSKPPLALDISDLLQQIETWGISTKKPLVSTSVYSRDSNIQPAYLWGLEKDKVSGNYLIALWNEVENNKGAVSYVSGGKPVGSGAVAEAKAKQGDIPGFMSLFWVIPSKNIVVALNTEDHLSIGINQLRAYLHGFMMGFSEQVVRADPKNSKHIAFSLEKKPKTPKDERITDPSLKASIQLPILRLNGEIKFIKDNVTEVRKLIRKVRVKTHNKKSIWNNVKDSVDFLFHSMEPTDNREIKIEYPTTISATDVNYFLKAYTDNDMADSFDVTFVFKGNIPNKSLSGAKAVDTFSNLNMHYKSDNTPDLLKLLAELNSKFTGNVDSMLAKKSK